MTEARTRPTDEARAALAFDRWRLAALASVVVLYAAARLWRLGATCLWFDELFGVHAARHEWGDMVRFVAADLIHPPLFYALLKLWVALGGESTHWLRLLPALTSIAALVPLLLLARALRFGARETTLALLLFATNGYLIKYAQEVRMYSLLLLLTLTSLWLFVRFLHDGRRMRGPLVALFVVNLLLVYTHYYGWLVVASQVLFVLLKRRERLPALLLTTAALLVCFAPWAYACLAAAGAGGGLAQNIGWQTRPGAADLWQLLALFQEPFYFRQSTAAPPYARWAAPLGLLLITAPLVSHLLRSSKRVKPEGSEASVDESNDDKSDVDKSDVERSDVDKSDVEKGDDDARTSPTSLLLVFALAPVIVAFALSYALPVSVWGTRHLIVAAAPYLLLAAVALARLRPAWLRSAVIVALGCWLALAGLLTLLRRQEQFVWCAWGELAARVARDEQTADPFDVYAFEDLVAYHLWFALGDAARGRGFNVAVVKNVPGLAEDPAYFLPRRFDDIKVIKDPSAVSGPRFWLAFRDTALDETRPPLNLLTARGYRVERVFETTAQGQRAFLILVSR